MAGPVIITRAEPGNSETYARLAAAQIPALKCPMLSLVPTGHALPDMTSVQGLLFTSANGVRVFADVSGDRRLKAWCVGPATFAAARAAGFTDLENADGNSDDLAELVMGSCDPGAGRLVHVANSAAAGQLADRLRRAGFEIVFAPLYEARPTEQLPAEVIQALRSEDAASVLVHSAKGASAFAGCLTGLTMARHSLVAVSGAAAGPLLKAGFRETVIAERPNEDALLTALITTYSTL